MGPTNPKREEACSERGGEEPSLEEVKVHQGRRGSEFHSDEEADAEETKEEPSPEKGG